jgi:hypothetical protein
MQRVAKSIALLFVLFLSFDQFHFAMAAGKLQHSSSFGTIASVQSDLTSSQLDSLNRQNRAQVCDLGGWRFEGHYWMVGWRVRFLKFSQDASLSFNMVYVGNGARCLRQLGPSVGYSYNPGKVAFFYSNLGTYFNAIAISGPEYYRFGLAVDAGIGFPISNTICLGIDANYQSIGDNPTGRFFPVVRVFFLK